MELNYHCSDCGHAWQGAGGQCPRCGSRWVRYLKRSNKNNATIAALMFSLGLMAWVFFMVVRSVGGVFFIEDSSPRLTVDGLEAERLYENLCSVAVTVHNGGNSAQQISLDDMEFYDDHYEEIYLVPVWPDGGEHDSAYLPAGRTLVIAGAVELDPGTERVRIAYYNNGKIDEIWAYVD